MAALSGLSGGDDLRPPSAVPEASLGRADGSPPPRAPRQEAEDSSADFSTLEPPEGMPAGPSNLAKSFSPAPASLPES